MAHVSEDEVLLLWRALSRFRSGHNPACARRGKPAHSICPLYDQCGRWSQPDDDVLILDETPKQTERRRANWPCTRLLDVLAPDVTRIS